MNDYLKEGFIDEVKGALKEINGIDGTGDGAEVFNDYKNNVASGKYSHAEGSSTTAYGAYSHTEGQYTKANGQSHAEGFQTAADGSAAHAEGINTIASGSSSHAEGYGSKASGDSSHAEGSSTASGDDSHSEGYSTANGKYSHAEGWSTASGEASHSENRSEAIGDYSHAEGYITKAFGEYSHAQGLYTTAIYPSQNVIGAYNTIESYEYSVSDVYEEFFKRSDTNRFTKFREEPVFNSNTGLFEFQGTGTRLPNAVIPQFDAGDIIVIDNDPLYKNSNAAWYYFIDSYVGFDRKTGYKHNIRKYTSSIISYKDAAYLHVVGNGSSDTERSNAHTLDWSGNAWYAGKILVGGTGRDDENASEVATKAYVEELIGGIENGTY